MFQKNLLDYLQKKLPKNTSIIEAVSIALELSYDAAHRRVSLKSKFSLEESILLAKYYNLSLDRLFEITDIHFISVEKTKNIRNEQELTLYLQESYASLTHLLQEKDAKILYSAKDIPLFYTISGDILSKFKMYVWLKLLDNSFTNLSFESFNPSLSLLQAGKELASLYNNIDTVEIWDITTINSTLKQVYYYFQAGNLSVLNALEICLVIKELIKEIEYKVLNTNYNLKIYYNELHLMNNHVLVQTAESKLLYVPFTLLSYYKTSDSLTCLEAKQFLEKQLQESKLLNVVGEKERNLFFNKIFAKIDALAQLLKATQILDFE